MKRNFSIAAVMAAAMLLGGCAETGESSENSLSVPTVQIDPASSAESTHEGAPEVIAPNFHGSLSTENSASEVPVESSSPGTSGSHEYTKPPVTVVERPTEYQEREIIGADETRTVSSGEELYVESGKLLDIEGRLIIEDGAALCVESGGALFVEGTVKLEGELMLPEGGVLLMGSDTASINGSGNVVVGKDFGQIDCEHGTIKAHITPPQRVVEDGVTAVGGVVIANKAIRLPPEYGSWLSDGEVAAEAYDALMEMNNDSDHWYYIVSAYRSYYSQESIFQGWCDIYGFEEASTISSQAGHSEHQTGLTMDLDSLEESYGDTAEGIWLAENCWRYGFIIRYPKGKEHITGYAYEPWHVRYLGKSTAKLVYDSGLTLEEFLNVEGGTVVIDV